MLLRSFLISLLGLLLMNSIATATERVDIVPQRVILQPRERAGEFTLLNRGNTTGTFRIEVLSFKQDQYGVYEELKQPLNPAFDPEKILRLSPRQFTLEPEARQKIRFSIRKPENLPEGEYRFHIRATRMSEYGPPAPVNDKASSVGMAMNIGVAIPVIIRHGQVQAGATLSDLAYNPSGQDGKPALTFTLNRTGNASILGTATAIWQPTGGQPQQIGSMGNLNVFTENAYRKVSMPLDTVPSGSGTIQLTYTNDETKTPYAEATLQR
jgi:P pilus assembly chaperone PapD